MQNVSEEQGQLQSQHREHEVALQTLQAQIQVLVTQSMNLQDQNAVLRWELQQYGSKKEMRTGQQDDLNIQANNHLLEHMEELRGLSLTVQKRAERCDKHIR